MWLKVRYLKRSVRWRPQWEVHFNILYQILVNRYSEEINAIDQPVTTWHFIRWMCSEGVCLSGTGMKTFLLDESTKQTGRAAFFSQSVESSMNRADVCDWLLCAQICVPTLAQQLTQLALFMSPTKTQRTTKASSSIHNYTLCTCQCDQWSLAGHRPWINALYYLLFTICLFDLVLIS